MFDYHPRCTGTVTEGAPYKIQQIQCSHDQTQNQKEREKKEEKQVKLQRDGTGKSGDMNNMEKVLHNSRAQHLVPHFRTARSFNAMLSFQELFQVYDVGKKQREVFRLKILHIQWLDQLCRSGCPSLGLVTICLARTRTCSRTIACMQSIATSAWRRTYAPRATA
jgi:hypothetical protein